MYYYVYLHHDGRLISIVRGDQRLEKQNAEMQLEQYYQGEWDMRIARNMADMHRLVEGKFF